MQVRYVVVALCVMLLAGLVTVRAEDAAKPKKDKAASAKLVKPWSDLKDLSEEQKTKIREIHAKALDEIKAIKEKENADITALLTDAQKDEVKSIAEKEKAEKKSAKKDEPTKKEEPTS